MDLQTYLKSLDIKYGIIKFNQPLPYKLCADAVAFPYWEVNSSTWDSEVTEAWRARLLMLNHKFTPDRILMEAKKFEKLLETAEQFDFGNFMDFEDTILEKWMEESEKISDSGVLAPGFMFATGVADGSAHYKVTKVNAKSVRYELRKFGDGYMDRVLGIDGMLTMDNFKRITRFGAPPLFSRKGFNG